MTEQKPSPLSTEVSETPAQQVQTDTTHDAPARHNMIIHTNDKTPGEILAYWTPERMAEAKPLPFPSPRSEGHPTDENRLLSAASPASPAAEEPGALTDYVTVQVPQEQLTQYPYRCVGKLLFTMNGEPKAGSAAVVDENGLITAAHNLYDPIKEIKAKDILFCPAFTDGFANKAFGVWECEDYTYPDRWKFLHTRTNDYGFIKLRLGGNGFVKKPIGEVVGILDTLVDNEPTMRTTWLSLGYPAIPTKGYNFDGKEMWLCEGTYIGEKSGVISKHGNFTEGASGGPWLEQLGDNDCWVNGVTSGGNLAGTENSSPYFDEWVEGLYIKYFGKSSLRRDHPLKGNGTERNNS